MKEVKVEELEEGDIFYATYSEERREVLCEVRECTTHGVFVKCFFGYYTNRQLWYPKNLKVWLIER